MPPTHTDEGVRAALVIRAQYPDVSVLMLSQWVEERYATELIASDIVGQLEHGPTSVGWLVSTSRDVARQAMSAINRRIAELPTAEWLRVLREARALGAVQLGLSGGEPLAREDLEEIVAEAHRLGFYINLITSGIGMSEARIKVLKQAGLDHIQLSFQDSTREMNDFLSSTRTFDLKAKVAALIRAYDYPMVLNVVLHRLNIDHVEEILNMAQSMGADYVELANTQYYGWAFKNRDRLLPSREQLARALTAVAELDAVVLGGVLIEVLREPVHRLENGAGRRTQIRGVEHRELFGHHELIAHGHPEFLVGRRGRGRQIEGAWPRRVRRQERGRTADGQEPGKVTTIHNPSAGDSTPDQAGAVCGA